MDVGYRRLQPTPIPQILQLRDKPPAPPAYPAFHEGPVSTIGLSLSGPIKKGTAPGRALIFYLPNSWRNYI